MRESEREEKQKGLGANPVHGQSQRSLIFLPRRCRQSSSWITTLYLIGLFKTASDPLFPLLLTVFIASQGSSVLGEEGEKKRTKLGGGRPGDRMSHGQCGATHG